MLQHKESVEESVGLWTADQTFDDNTKLKFGTGSDSVIYYDGTDTFWDLQAVGSGALMLALDDSFPSPDADVVHIWDGDAGSITANAGSQLVIESAGDGAGLSILAPNNVAKIINFGEPASATRGRFVYFGSTDTPSDTFDFQTAGTSRLRLSANTFAFQEATTITASIGDLLLTSANDVVHVKAGADEGSIVSVLDAHPGTVQTGANTVEKVLYTYTLSASTFVNIGDSVIYQASGTFASNGNSKTLTAYLGSKALGTLTGTYSGRAWDVEVHAYMTGTDTQRVITKITVNGVTTDVEYDAASEDDEATIALEIRGTNGTAAAADIVKRIANTVFYPEHS